MDSSDGFDETGCPKLNTRELPGTGDRSTDDVVTFQPEDLDTFDDNVLYNRVPPQVRHIFVRPADDV